MSDKKSYMDTKNIISEGWISKLIFKIVNNLKKKKRNLDVKKATTILTKNQAFQNKLKDLNKKTKDLEKMLQDLTGEPVKLNKYELDDFIG